MTYITFLKELFRLKAQMKTAEDSIPFGKLYPCLKDRGEQSGTSSGHYFHQDLLVATRIFEAQPEKHVDIGSRIDGFVAHVAAFREIEVLDVRPLEIACQNIRFKQADLMREEPSMEAYCDSVSCLHALEHFGLGRYGDILDYNGHRKGLDAITRLLTVGGTLYLSVPIGPLRIEFNAHRVFSLSYLLEIFSVNYEVKEFSYVDDHGDLHRGMQLTEELIGNNCGCRYGCGIFELRRIACEGSEI